MSGHSKWKNIMHKKEKSDAQRAKAFTKIGREISVCVKQGGADPNVNAKLKDLIAKAKSNNVPNENIERVIKKAAGEGDKNQYEHITYEGYGPSGVAVIVEALTDNRNRTAGDLRHYFDKCGGNLGQPGSVSWMFAEKGVLVTEGSEAEEDRIMEAALNAGAADFSAEDGVFEILTESETFSKVRGAMEQSGYAFCSAEVEKIPDNYVTLQSEDDRKNMRRLLHMLEDNDDIQEVYHNWENEEEE